MAFSINDYLIEHQGIDWPTVLSNWSWLLPRELTLWMVNRFADLIVVLSDGSVWMLDVGVGSFNKLAESRDDFCERIDENENANDWLMIPLVDGLVHAGMRLGKGQCYGFKKPPLLGGEYEIENCGVLSISDYLVASGSIHEQLIDVPDGTRVVLRGEGSTEK